MVLRMKVSSRISMFREEPAVVERPGAAWAEAGLGDDEMAFGRVADGTTAEVEGGRSAKSLVSASC
ncbi:hypothetical protein BLOT_004743 [Blomia tropicalis]|nr:hypothetical protein BLOT_004743 [Blomia tropicalis]